jgi:putative colanic acid biosynthesis UDP-glucose lipid carrier transferase
MSKGPGLSVIESSATSWLLALLLVWVLICDRMQLSQFYPHRTELMARVVVATAIAGMSVVVLNLGLSAPLPGFRISIYVAVFFANVSIVRLVRRAIYVRGHLGPGKRQRAVIIGSGPLARELAIALNHDPTRRYEVTGFLAPEMEEMAGVFPNLAKESTVATLGVSEYLARTNVNQVYLALPNSADPHVLRLVAQCRERGIAVSFVPNSYELFITRSVLRHIGGIPLVAIDERHKREILPQWKVPADACVAAVLLLLTAPLMGVVAVILRQTRGRAFRRETRCGIGGRPFDMYRFNIERQEVSGSRFERWLEITSISELPQLFNVIRGEMSLVGPRPETRGRVKHYSEWQEQRLQYKPGITGYAQLYGLRERNSSAEKARHDIRYPLGWSPLLDLTMILQTLWIISCQVARARLSTSRSDLGSNAMPVNVEGVSSAYIS